MLKNMKRGDRVMTAGGILGTVVDVRDAEVVLKVDESTNTKIKFSRDAIKRVSPTTSRPRNELAVAMRWRRAGILMRRADLPAGRRRIAF